MKWEEFIKKAGNLPVVDTEILLAGLPNSRPLKVQISRWRASGKLIQLKRGIYLLDEIYRKVETNGFYIASLLKQPSYISLEKALEYHGLIPEAVYVYTSVTTKRQGEFVSKAGRFDYRHIKKSLFWGYNSLTINNQTAFIALPEKALLDFFYLKDVKISLDYLEEMRLQNTEKINFDKLLECAKKFKKPSILRAAELIKEYIVKCRKKEKTL
ncbi:MAG: hypothetical protein ABIH18_05205 [Candidatus Omnitrophota bacterium]